MRYKLLILGALFAAVCGSAALAAAAYVVSANAEAARQGQPPHAPSLDANGSKQPERGPLVAAAQKAPEVPPVAAPPAAAAISAPDPLLGDWRMAYLGGGESAVLKIDKVTRGIVGAALTGALTLESGKACPLSGAIFDAIAGMYPDGAKIMTMEIRGMMRVVANCDGRTTTIEAFVVNNQGKFFGAGRASFAPPSPAQPTISTIQLIH